MTQDKPHSPPAATVQGAWQGATDDPQREFQGRVTESTIAGLDDGIKVKVRYVASEKRTPHAAEHGRYLLQAGGREWPLMSFTCRSVGTSGSQGNDDTQVANWQAVALPE